MNNKTKSEAYLEALYELQPELKAAGYEVYSLEDLDGQLSLVDWLRAKQYLSKRFRRIAVIGGLSTDKALEGATASEYKRGIDQVVSGHKHVPIPSFYGHKANYQFVTCLAGLTREQLKALLEDRREGLFERVGAQVKEDPNKLKSLINEDEAVKHIQFLLR